jgi:hypothetical protein
MGKLAHSAPALGSVGSAAAQPLLPRALAQPQEPAVVVGSLAETVPPQGSASRRQQLPALALVAAQLVDFSALSRLQQEVYSAAQQPQQHLQQAAACLVVQVEQALVVELQAQVLAVAPPPAVVSSAPQLRSPQLDSADLDLLQLRQLAQELVLVLLVLDRPPPQRQAVDFSVVDRALRVLDLALRHSQLRLVVSVLVNRTSKLNNQPKPAAGYLVEEVHLARTTSNRSPAVFLAPQHQQQEADSSDSPPSHSNPQAVDCSEAGPSNSQQAVFLDRSLPQAVVSLVVPLLALLAVYSVAASHSKLRLVVACLEALSNSRAAYLEASQLPQA